MPERQKRVLNCFVFDFIQLILSLLLIPSSSFSDWLLRWVLLQMQVQLWFNPVTRVRYVDLLSFFPDEAADICKRVNKCYEVRHHVGRLLSWCHTNPLFEDLGNSVHCGRNVIEVDVSASACIVRIELDQKNCVLKASKLRHFDSRESLIFWLFLPQFFHQGF